MRVSEKERLKALRQKQQTGTELSEKEIARLESLEELERKEIEKDAPGGKEINGSRGNIGNSGNGLGESESTKQGKRSEHASYIKGLGKSIDGDNTDVIGQTEPIGQTDRSNGSINDTNGSDRGFIDCEEYGRDRGDQGGTNGNENGGSDNPGEEKTLIRGKTSNLIPDTNIKPQRKRKKNQVENPVVNNELDFIAIVLQSGFSMIANVTNRSYWNITEDEATSVSVPLTKMFDSLDKVQKKKFEKYINPVMLGSAIAGIVVPRVMRDMKEGGQYGKRKTFGNNRSVNQNNDNGDTKAGSEAGNANIVKTANTDISTIFAGFSK